MIGEEIAWVMKHPFNASPTDLTNPREVESPTDERFSRTADAEKLLSIALE
jgi:hypothetical protein